MEKERGGIWKGGGRGCSWRNSRPRVGLIPTPCDLFCRHKRLTQEAFCDTAKSQGSPPTTASPVNFPSICLYCFSAAGARPPAPPTQDSRPAALLASDWEVDWLFHSAATHSLAVATALLPGTLGKFTSSFDILACRNHSRFGDSSISSFVSSKKCDLGESTGSARVKGSDIRVFMNFTESSKAEKLETL